MGWYTTLLEDQLPADSFLLGDKAYDAEWIRTMIEAQTPWRSFLTVATSRLPMPSVTILYRLRNRVERFFNKLSSSGASQHATKKLAANYLAMIKLATIRILMVGKSHLPPLTVSMAGHGRPLDQ